MEVHLLDVGERRIVQGLPVLDDVAVSLFSDEVFVAVFNFASRFVLQEVMLNQVKVAC